MVIANNALWKGARGSLDEFVFQTVGDQVIVRSKPRKRKVPVWKQSERQQRTRQNFKDAAVYARSVTHRGAEKRAYYMKKAKAIGVRSAYSAAISDYMRGLTIEDVDTRRYSGKVGGQVKVTVRKKDFAAKEVHVIFKTMDGEVIEQGKAVMEVNGAWVYKNLVGTGERTVVIEIEAVNWNGRIEKKTSTLVLE
jgi:hypothetical protein